MLIPTPILGPIPRIGKNAAVPWSATLNALPRMARWDLKIAHNSRIFDGGRVAEAPDGGAAFAATHNRVESRNLFPRMGFTNVRLPILKCRSVGDIRAESSLPRFGASHNLRICSN